MRTKGETGMKVFEPAWLEIAPGDTVHFRALDPGRHAASVDGVAQAFTLAEVRRGTPERDPR